jgi:hypothetical protein
MKKENCCEMFGGDETDNCYRMLFGHHPFCPRLKEIDGLLSKKDFDKSLNHFYQFWKKTELDKIKNEFYANNPSLINSPQKEWKRIKTDEDLPTDAGDYFVTLKIKEMFITEIAYFERAHKTWHSKVIWDETDWTEDVAAWAKLPAAYTE